MCYNVLAGLVVQTLHTHCQMLVSGVILYVTFHDKTNHIALTTVKATITKYSL